MKNTMKFGLIIINILLITSLSSCAQLTIEIIGGIATRPTTAPHVNLQGTADLPKIQVSNITTTSSLLVLSKFEHVSRRDIKNASRIYKRLKTTQSVTLMPGRQTFMVSYDDINHHKKTYITIPVQAGNSYTINHKKENGDIIIWVVNDDANLTITHDITM